MRNKVFAIIVTYNPNISEFINNLIRHCNTSVDGVIIIDNCSENKVELEGGISSSLGKMKIFKSLNANLGIGAAQNIGIKIAKENSCTHVLLFDQDTSVPNNILEILLKEEVNLLSQGISVGAIGPIYKDPRTNSLYPLALTKGMSLKTIYPVENEYSSINVSFIIASGSLIRASVIEEVGGLYEPFFIDLVDIEWCFRAMSKGYKIFASPKVCLNHSIGDKRIVSFGKEISIHSPLRRYYIIRNNLLLFRFGWVPLGYRMRIAFGVVIKSFRFLSAVNWDRQYRRLILKGFYDGIFNKGGAIKLK